MWITNVKIRDFLELNGLLPHIETKEQAYFKRSMRLFELLELYTITNYFNK